MNIYLYAYRSITKSALYIYASGYYVHTGSMKGQEERDNYFGLIFGLASIIQSGRCTGDKLDKKLVSDIVDKLVQLSTKKSYLREPALQVCVALFSGRCYMQGFKY